MNIIISVDVGKQTGCCIQYDKKIRYFDSNFELILEKIEIELLNYKFDKIILLFYDDINSRNLKTSKVLHHYQGRLHQKLNNFNLEIISFNETLVYNDYIKSLKKGLPNNLLKLDSRVRKNKKVITMYITKKLWKLEKKELSQDEADSLQLLWYYNKICLLKEKKGVITWKKK